MALRLSSAHQLISSSPLSETGLVLLALNNKTPISSLAQTQVMAGKCVGACSFDPTCLLPLVENMATSLAHSACPNMPDLRFPASRLHPWVACLDLPWRAYSFAPPRSLLLESMPIAIPLFAKVCRSTKMAATKSRPVRSLRPNVILLAYATERATQHELDMMTIATDAAADIRFGQHISAMRTRRGRDGID